MVPKTVQDAGYAAVGLGVLALQQVQTRRRELAARVGTDLASAGRAASGVLSGVRTLTAPIAERLGDLPKRPALPALPPLPGPLASAMETTTERARRALRNARN